MSDAEGWSRRRVWFTALAAALVFWLWSGPAVPCACAQDKAPAESTEADDEPPREDNDKKESARDEDAEDAPDAEDDQSERVSEEVDREVEVEPDEEEGNEPPADGEGAEAEPPKKEKRVIGATATVLEKQSNMLFRARVDTGAKSCSLHVEELTIGDEQEKWVDNIGKVARFKVRNHGEDAHWLEARIEGYVIIKTSESRARRYKVPLTLRWKGVEKTVMVTLNDRNGMDYPLLLGRNFLRDDFVVDVDIDNDD